MVMKYIILADCSIGFDTPRQLSVVNGEPIIKRTIRLLKENGINDILITSHDKRFDDLGVVRYEPKYNYYIPNYDDYTLTKGYWLNAFPIELLNEPVCFMFGDVYYSENAVKTIVETETNDLLFFCSYNNKSSKYIKDHDEPLAYKVVNYDLFKKHINIVKKLKDEGKCCREPIVWELYRSINEQDINTHVMTKNYIAINDESCDIDTKHDIILLNKKLGGIKMIKCEVIEQFTLERFDELKNIVRKGQDVKGKLFYGDIFECDEELANYLMGGNDKGKVVVKIIEVKPEIKPIPNAIPEEVKIIPIPNAKVEEVKIKPLKSTKKKKTSKK